MDSTFLSPKPVWYLLPPHCPRLWGSSQGVHGDLPGGAHCWMRTCKFSPILMAKAYRAPDQAASALNAMALLQVFQAKALNELHKGCSDLGLMQ